MATYVYKFEDGSLVEVQQSMTDEPYAVLPHPYKSSEDNLVYEDVKRVPSWGTDPVFRGPGFYKTDKSK